jgi:hypothetical protein
MQPNIFGTSGRGITDPREVQNHPSSISLSTSIQGTVSDRQEGLHTENFEWEIWLTAHKGLQPHEQTFHLRPKINQEKEF